MKGSNDSYTMRRATLDDVVAINALIAASARGLSVGYYTDEQVDAAIRFVFGADTQLIRDGTYHLVSTEDGLVACGGWSMRRTLHGGDQAKGAEDPLVDPATDAARIRAFFVHPDHARRGLARRLFDTCEREARAAGFTSFELAATRPGEPLYAALGFRVLTRGEERLPNGVVLELAHMRREI